MYWVLIFIKNVSFWMSGPSLEKTTTEPDSFRPGEPGLRAHFLWDSLQARAFGKGLGSFHLYLYHYALEFFWDELYESPLVLMLSSSFGPETSQSNFWLWTLTQKTLCSIFLLICILAIELLFFIIITFEKHLVTIVNYRSSMWLND